MSEKKVEPWPKDEFGLEELGELKDQKEIEAIAPPPVMRKKNVIDSLVGAIRGATPTKEQVTQKLSEVGAKAGTRVKEFIEERKKRDRNRFSLRGTNVPREERAAVCAKTSNPFAPKRINFGTHSPELAARLTARKVESPAPVREEKPSRMKRLLLGGGGRMNFGIMPGKMSHERLRLPGPGLKRMNLGRR